jgi:hypothetical protein
MFKGRPISLPFFLPKNEISVYISMQIINQASSNTCVFTLKEKQTLTSPYFLFELYCEVSEQTYYFISTDISSYTDRYNKFTIVEPTNVVLSVAGQYNYRIFEQSSNTNLNPSLATTLLESGIIKVVGTNAVKIVYNPTQDNIVIYGGND